MRRFKYGVSNWTLTFNDDSEFLIDTVNNENILYNCDGHIIITINDCVLRKDIIDKFKIDNAIKILKQEILFYIGFDSEITKEVWEYENVIIKEIKVNSIIKECSMVGIVIEV